MKPSSTTAAIALLALVGAASAQPTLTVLPGVGGQFGFQFLPTTISDDGTRMVGYGNGCWRWGVNDIPQFTPFSSSASWISADSTCSRVMLEQYIDWNSRQRYCATWLDDGSPANVCTPVTGWYGCDDDIANCESMSGNGQRIAALIWGDTTCPNPLASGACCVTSPGVFDIPSQTWTILPKTSASVSAKVNVLSRDGNCGAGWDTNVGARHGCAWINGVQHVIKIGTAQCAEANGISDNGVWTVGHGSPTNLQTVWLWNRNSADNAAVDLGTVPASISSGNVVEAMGVSDNGRIVIGARGTAGFFTAFIWRQGIGYQSMDSYLASLGIVMENYIPYYDRTCLAMDMSPTGRYIALQGTDLGGTYYPMILDTGPQPCSPADMGSQGGVAIPDYTLDNNDFIVFIDRFFNQEASADLGQQGGIAGSDGQFDNNDFIVFIDIFFAGC